MSRRFTFVTVALTAVVAFLVGAIVAGGFLRPSVGAQATISAPRRAAVTADRSTIGAPRGGGASLVNFADVVERVNAAVVNIDATSAGPAADSRRRNRLGLPDSPEMFERPREAPRRA